MAIYHMSAKIIKRSGGGKAVASSAYRSGEKLKDFSNGETYDYTRKSGVVYAEIIAPEGSPEWAKNRESLWNAAEAIEKRKDAQVAREIEVALPVELDKELQIELARGYVAKTFVADGMAADMCIHDKGDGNPHAHIMLTMREVTPEGFGGKDKRSKNQTVWNKPEALKAWRETWSAEANAALERAGSERRMDHRSFAERGFEREPEIHLGPAAAAMERRGEASDRGNRNREIRELNALIGERDALEPEISSAVRTFTQEGRAAACASLAVWKKEKAERQRRQLKRQAQEEKQRRPTERERENQRGEGFSR